MASSPLRITLARKTLPELLGRVILRVWHGLNEVPEWFEHGLKMAKPVLGYGVLDPLELRITETEMSTICVASDKGKTVMESLHASSSGFRECEALSILEQICFGLLRIHKSQRSAHGAITPFNVHLTEDGKAKLWSVPSTRLELSFGDMDEDWELPFRSPQVRACSSPTVQDDIYSLGVLFARLVSTGKDNFEAWKENGSGVLEISETSKRLIDRCTAPGSASRYQSVAEFVEEFNSESSLLRLDLDGALDDKELAKVAFHNGEFDTAISHWQDALRKDWLDTTSHNNLGVSRCALEDWEQGLHDLEKAHKISAYHPLLNCNIGYCHYKLGDFSSAEYWTRRARQINPNYWQPLIRLAEMSKDWGQLETSLKMSLEALLMHPKCRLGRLLAAEVFEKLGNQSEADSQRACVKALEESQPFADFLITEETPPPWNLLIGTTTETLLDRYGVDVLSPDRRTVAGWIKQRGEERDTKYGEPNPEGPWLGFPRGWG